MGGITQTVNPVEDCGRDSRVVGKPGDEVGRRQVGSGGRTQQVAGRRSQAGEQHWQSVRSVRKAGRCRAKPGC